MEMASVTKKTPLVGIWRKLAYNPSVVNSHSYFCFIQVDNDNANYILWYFKFYARVLMEIMKCLTFGHPFYENVIVAPTKHQNTTQQGGKILIWYGGYSPGYSIWWCCLYHHEMLYTYQPIHIPTNQQPLVKNQLFTLQGNFHLAKIAKNFQSHA